MENVTIISMHATYGLAVILFLVAAGYRMQSRYQYPGMPPALPFGKVAAWYYRKTDLICVALIVGFYCLMLILNSLLADKVTERSITASDIVFNFGLQMFLAGLPLVIVLRRVAPVDWLGLQWKKWPWILLIGPGAVLTIWAFAAALDGLGYYDLMDKLGVNQPQETVKLLRESSDATVLILLAFTAVVVAPICEEIVFRGFIYPVLKKFTGPWVGALVSSMFFAAAHGSLPPLILFIALGIALVAVYEWSGSIWAPIAVHFFFNAASVVLMLLVKFEYIPDQTLQ